MKFINLTNGIEAIGGFDAFHIIRIQSSHCERHCWDKVILGLSDDLLFFLSQGIACCIYDYSAKKECPRSLYQGLVFIEYCLNRCWFNKNEPIKVKGHNCQQLFDDWYRNLSDNAMNHIKYYRRILNAENIQIEWKAGATIHDGDYEWYKNEIKNRLKSTQGELSNGNVS